MYCWRLPGSGNQVSIRHLTPAQGTRGFPFKNFMRQISRSLLTLGKSSDDNLSVRQKAQGRLAFLHQPCSLLHCSISLADFNDSNCYAYVWRVTPVMQQLVSSLSDVCDQKQTNHSSYLAQRCFIPRRRRQESWDQVQSFSGLLFRLPWDVAPKRCDTSMTGCIFMQNGAYSCKLF